MKYTFFILGFLVTQLSLAQSPNFNVSFSSPNAASLGLYGEVPVSLHNGVPNIGIPIYEINEGPIKVPISLNYHASGVRPDVHPGWVGNGWTLNCGGMITRVTKNMPDETAYLMAYNIYGLSGGQTTLGFLPGHFFNNLLQPNNWATSSRIDTLARKGTEYNYGGSSDYFKDTEPDEFVFNFNGYNGKFIFDQNGQIRCISHPEIKVEIEDVLDPAVYYDIQYPYNLYTFYKTNILPGFNGDITLSDYKIRGFRITTPDGMQYEFGAWNSSGESNDYPYEYSMNFFQQVYSSENWDTWYLKRIKSPDSHTVTFYYGIPEDGIYSPIGSFAKTFAIEKANGSAPGKGLFKIFGPVSANSTSITEYYTGRTIFPSYVTKIVTSNEEISFKTGITRELRYDSIGIVNSLQEQAGKSFDPTIYNYTPAQWYIIDTVYDSYLDFSLLKWRQLNEIKVKNRTTQETVKSWAFKYSSDSTKRLTLLSLEQKGSTTDSSLKHTFTYNTSKTLPAYNSYRTDHWGFYNGRFPALYDLTDASLDSFYAKRNTDTSYLYAGILEKINFPTGGYTQLVYEPNQYSKIVQRNTTTGNFSLQTVTPKYAGGLRIKQVINHAGNGDPDVVKNYEYNEGILNGDLQYFWKSYQGRLANGNNYTCDRFVSQTLLPVSTNSVGSHVGYSKVRESISGNGYTEYYYTNYDILDDNFLATIDPQKSRFSPFSERSIERGLLYKKLDYNQSDILLKEQHITYILADTSKYSRATAAKNFNVLGGLAVEGSSYKIYTYPYKEKQVKTILHDQADSSKKIITTTDMEYDSQYSLLQWEKTLDSRGDTLKTNYKYPFNYSGQAVYEAMVARNRISPVIEQANYRNSNFLRSARTNYEYWSSSLIAPISVESKTGSSASEIRQRVFGYDKNGNVLQTAKDRDVHFAYVWDYNQQYPIAECGNADTSSIAYTSFEADGKGRWIFSGTPSAYLLAITGKKAYNLNGSNTIIRPDLNAGKTYVVSYWTRNNSAFSISGTQSGYPVAGKTVNGWKRFEHRITGQAQITIGGTGWIDELCLYPEDGQMKTLTYDLIVGITSQTDIHRNIIYYTYDAFTRLILIKDDENNILKRVCYNYTGQPENCNLYGNVQKSGNFTRSTCTGDSVGNQVTYIVTANKYYATSQAQADTLAQVDVNANGQSYANSNATCLKAWYNVQKSGNFTKNDCGSGYTGSTETYIVADHTYVSTVNQAAADALAQNDVDTNGQGYANTYGSCTPDGFTLYYQKTSYNYYPVYFTFTDLATTQQYNFETPTGYPTSGILGQLPPGYYDVEIYNPNNAGYHYYETSCLDYASGYTYTSMNYIYLDEYCNTINIDY